MVWWLIEPIGSSLLRHYFLVFMDACHLISSVAAATFTSFHFLFFTFIFIRSTFALRTEEKRQKQINLHCPRHRISHTEQSAANLVWISPDGSHHYTLLLSRRAASSARLNQQFIPPAKFISALQAVGRGPGNFNLQNIPRALQQMLLNDTFLWPPVKGGKGGEIKSLNKKIKPPPGLGLEIGLGLEL